MEEEIITVKVLYCPRLERYVGVIDKPITVIATGKSIEELGENVGLFQFTLSVALTIEEFGYELIEKKEE